MKDFVSIITLNYNGLQFLERFFNSTRDIDYPEQKYEVIMVDNNSTDGSVEFVEKNFPEVKIINAGENLGFGRGNNLGIKSAKGDLVFILNNDTVLNKDSLKEVVKCFSSWSKKEKIGAVNAKLVMIDKYLPFLVEEAHFSDYSLPKKATPVNREPLVVSQETNNGFVTKVLLPIKHEFRGKLGLTLSLKPFRKNEYIVKLGDKVFHKGNFEGLGAVKKVRLELTKKALSRVSTDLIQNAGNFYFRDGSGRDRGTVIYKHKQFFEEDKGQYDKEEFVKGFCGAGVLLNKKALSEVGLFDKDFFLYYEDSELSFRLRQNGWRILYCPSSVVRHIHSATNKEWSDLFIYNAERGRLLFLAKHWPRWEAVKGWLKYIFKDTFAIFIYHLLKGYRKEAFRKLRLRVKVNLSLLVPFTRSLWKNKRLSYGELKEFS